MPVVYQAIVVGLCKEYQSRFGIYSTLDDAKCAIEYNFLNTDNELNVEEAYIEEIELDATPDVGKRQGRKICYIDDQGSWTLYKSYQKF
jgi:hypothetical protein